MRDLLPFLLFFLHLLLAEGGQEAVHGSVWPGRYPVKLLKVMFHLAVFRRIPKFPHENPRLKMLHFPPIPQELVAPFLC